MTERIVVGFSGGLASTAAVPWLTDRYGVDVVAVVVALGQPRRELEGIRERAIAAGAVRCHVRDLEETFAREFVWPAVRARVDPALPALTVAAPLIARALVEMAHLERATAVAHGATGRVARQIEQAVRALAPELRVVPTAVHELGERHALTAYTEALGLAPPDVADLRADVSLWGRSITGPAAGDIPADVADDVFVLTRAPQACPDDPAIVEIAFDRGVPIAVTGVSMPFTELMESLSTIAGTHGVGRADHAVPTPDGRPARELRESPALTVLRQAHEALEQLTPCADGSAFRDVVSAQYTAVLREGLWFSPFRSALDAYVDAVQSAVSGTVRLALLKGNSRVVGRRAERYDRHPADAPVPVAR